MTHIGKKAALAVFAVLAFMPTLMFAYIGQFSRPVFDDYWRIGLPLDLGIWKAMLYMREIWNGDYTNFLFQGLLAPVGSMVTSAFPLVLILAMLFGYSWLINKVLSWKNTCTHPRLSAVTLASLMTAATINAFYDFEQFFWYTGAVEYSFPTALLLIGIAVSVETAQRLRGRFQHGLAAAAIIFLSFLNAGFSEAYMGFQMSFVALIAVFVFSLYRGMKRETYFILALAACLGTFASIPVQLSSPGIAYRTSLSQNFDYAIAPVRDLPQLLSGTTELLMNHLGDQNVFAGFVLTAFAGLFVALTACDCQREHSKLRHVAIARSPIALALIVQLLFIPILWSHQSDNVEFLGRFSYSFMSVVGINLCVILVLLALLWRRDLLEAALNRRNSLMIYCSGILLAVCVLFVLTQIRSIHFKASIYLFVTAVGAMLMLAGQLTLAIGQPRLNGLLQLTVCLTASTVIIMASLIAATQFAVGYLLVRIITSPILLLTCAGLCCGITLGTLIQHCCSLTGSNALWLQWMRLLLLLVIVSILLGLMLGQANRLSGVRIRADIWDANSAEIVKMRHEGNPMVYTKVFKRNTSVNRKSPYIFSTLSWYELAFYELEYDLPEDPYRPKNRQDA